MDLTELCRITGEPIEELLRWQQLGLLPGGEGGEMDRNLAFQVRAIQFAQRRGIAPEQIAEALADQPDLLTFLQGGIHLPTGPGRSLEEAAQEAGIDAELARRVRHAAGLDDQPILYDEDVDALRTFAVAGQAGVPEEALLQLVRVYADALGRVGEAENRLFHLHVHDQFRAQGLRGAALLQATQQVSDQVIDLAEPTVVYFYRKAFEHASLEDMILHLREDVIPPSDLAGQMTSTVMFIDLADFTPLTVAMGDAVATQVVDRFCDIVRKSTEDAGGRIVKQIGDAFMIVFGEPGFAITCGLGIEAAVADEPQFPAVHIGAHTGQLLYREGDYWGNTVNVAARVAAEAAPRQRLISAPLRDAVGDPPGVEFIALGARRLKGIAEPVELFDARRVGDRPQRLRDPVCGMEIRPGDEHARLVWDGQEIAFCSSACLQRFTADPQAHHDRGDK